MRYPPLECLGLRLSRAQDERVQAGFGNDAAITSQSSGIIQSVDNIDDRSLFVMIKNVRQVSRIRP